MDVIKDFIYVNKHSFKKASVSLSKNYLIILTGIAYSLISLLAFNILGIAFAGPLSIIRGFILYFIQSTIISNYLYLLFNIVNYNRFTLNDFKQGFMYFIWKVYGVLFIIYVAQLLLSALNSFFGPNASLINFIIQIGILVLLNPLPETIYLKGYMPQDTLLYTFDFMKENWLNWVVPNIIFYLIIYFISGQLITDLFATGISFRFNYSPVYILRYLLAQTIFSFMMIYRGYLYRLLSTSTMRKRMFMNRY